MHCKSRIDSLSQIHEGLVKARNESLLDFKGVECTTLQLEAVSKHKAFVSVYLHKNSPINSLHSLYERLGKTQKKLLLYLKGVACAILQFEALC
jgi:hypothetical protein